MWPLNPRSGTLVRIICGLMPVISAGCAPERDLEVSVFRQAETSVTQSKTAVDRYVFRTFKVDPKAGMAYELSLARCGKKKCPVEVRLVDATAVYQTLALDWTAAVGEPSEDTVAPWSGVGDPLETNAELTAWSTGEEETAVSTAARTVDLIPSLKGLLVHQSAGFEHVKRRHYLFVATGKTLVRAWTGEEGEGPTYSSVDVTDAGARGRQRILFWRFFAAQGNTADPWELAAYQWSSEKHLLEKLPPQDSPRVFAAILGSYESVAEARKLLATEGECLPSFRVLASSALGVPRGGGNFVIAGLTAREPLAVEALKAAHACAPRLKGRVLKLSLTQGGKDGGH